MIQTNRQLSPPRPLQPDRQPQILYVLGQEIPLVWSQEILVFSAKWSDIHYQEYPMPRDLIFCAKRSGSMESRVPGLLCPVIDIHCQDYSMLRDWSSVSRILIFCARRSDTQLSDSSQTDNQLKPLIVQLPRDPIFCAKRSFIVWGSEAGSHCLTKIRC